MKEKLSDKDLAQFVPEHVLKPKVSSEGKDFKHPVNENKSHIGNEEETGKSILLIKHEKSDSLEIKEDSKGNIHPVLKIYFDSENPNELKRISDLWIKVQKEVLKREL